MSPVLLALAALLATQPPVRSACDSSSLPADSGDARAWNGRRALALAQRATCRRRLQLADTGLRDYKALARGYLTFLGQLGEGLTEPPRVVQATQVATEVYWKAPNVSKQKVIGERDTTVLPTDNQFYRDRYGIVQNNFPDVIRVGEGRDVADVPHPLSIAGLMAYDFAVRDSLRIRVGGSTLAVIELQVRPREPEKPRFVGSLFIDRDDAQVVRMAFTFTRAAYLDKRNEDVSIVLENALVQGRFWLPRHQEVEVRRTGTFLDFPARGIIRGRWEIGDYDINPGLAPQTFAGAPLEFAPSSAMRTYPFTGRVLDSLPADVRSVTDEDVRRVQAQARALVQREVLARARGSALSARSVSDFVRVNRVEGLAFGAGYVARLGHGVSFTARGRYGIDDERAKVRASLQRQWADGSALRVSGYTDFREAGDEPEGSVVRNSLASQEFGSDWTDPYQATGAALGLDVRPVFLGLRPTFELALEREGPVHVHATPFAGRYEPTIDARLLDALQLTVGAERATDAGPFGTEWRGAVQARVKRWNPAAGRFDTCGASGGQCGDVQRLALSLHVERPFGSQRLVSHTTFAAAHGTETTPTIAGTDDSPESRIPHQDLVYLGGPVTGPGYPFHWLVGSAGASQRIELRTPVPFPSFSLGPYGRSPGTATLAPYAHTVWLDRPLGSVRLGRPAAERGGWYPALGMGAYVFFDLLRFDVARGLRDGRWTFSVDVTRDFWRIL